MHRVHPEFKERHPHIHSAALLPGEIRSFRVTFLGDKDSMLEVDALVNWMATDEVSNELKRKGYTVQTADFSDKALEQHSEVRTAWHNVQRMYAKALKDVADRRQKQFTYTLGPSVNVLADYVGSDVLVFVNGECLQKSGGELAKDIFWNLIAGSTVQQFQTNIKLGIVDGNTGDLLWLNQSTSPATNPTNADLFRPLVQGMLQAFPGAHKEKEGGHTDA